MSTRQIIAAIGSIAILGSTIAIFQTSSRSHARPVAATNATVMLDSRPVHELEPVVVNASPLPPETIGTLGSPSASARSGFALPSLDNTSLNTGSPLFMPYYSFANDLHTIIKD